ncbi:hypothetical protein ACX5HH_000003 [Providencia stuartii]|uniref:hypothetical protein n=1 Tax=Providencia TaxID=586 RepID=UPI00123B2DF2|nr:MULTISPECIES: hypothetical protein [Providencia]MDX7494050.1 hypothetical protein [Providencia stuartii]QET99464.1 hypothetical protein FOB53_20630 [Providencia stuartii]QPN39322.1 hypothetical protein I3B46_14440 [Providencia sp. 2.29]
MDIWVGLANTALGAFITIIGQFIMLWISGRIERQKRKAAEHNLVIDIIVELSSFIRSCDRYMSSDIYQKQGDDRYYINVKDYPAFSLNKDTDFSLMGINFAVRLKTISVKLIEIKRELSDAQDNYSLYETEELFDYAKKLYGEIKGDAIKLKEDICKKYGHVFNM